MQSLPAAMKKILVLCTGNSCRSQMAQAYLQYFAGPKAEIYSAGVEAHGVNPRAVQVMKEDGIDISAHTSDLLDKYLHMDLDYVITVCDNAKERCPYFPTRALRLHHNFPDPAKIQGSEAEINAGFRGVRDEIRDFCRHFVSTYLSD
jgi:arsenate reductase (thioredoxin)